MARKTIGKLPPRYSLMLNSYVEERLSKCPICKRQTHARKFPLLIDIRDFGPLVLGKTCKYCSLCELIIVHQHELEAELVTAFEKLAPECIGNEYLIIGTMEKKIWQAGLTDPGSLSESLEHVAEFRKQFDLIVDPGGWQKD